MHFLKNITSLYNKIIMFLQKKHAEKNIYFKNSTTKRIVTSCCDVNFTKETEKKRKEIEEDLKVIVKKYINEPEKLIQYIKMQGVNVYKVNNAEKILKKIGEEEGFITPLKGLKALFLNSIINFLTENKTSLKLSTNEMFIFNTNKTEIYTIARALYKYFGYKNNMPGYDYKTQEIFKKVYNRKSRQRFFSTCSINDMYACKEAIARDLESINFTINLSVEYDGSKNALKKIKETNSANI